MAYRADIEIAVRGAQQLRQLSRDIRNVSDLVDGLNGYLETFGNGISRSFNNVSDAVQDARNNLNKAVIGTQEATAAAYQLVRAEAELNEVLADREKLLKKVRIAGKPTAGPVGGFPVEGPMASPGFRGMQRNVGKFGENLALGAGFPLLFGGGPGAVVGSVLGSFVGTGFGGQILGGAIGQVLDQTLVKIKDIGNAIKQLNFDTLIESGMRFSTEVQAQLNLLLQVGDTLTAQKLISQEVARETGTLPGVTEDVANSVNILNDSWRKTVNAVSTTAGIIAAPLAVALAGILEIVSNIFKGVNTILSLLGTGIKTAAEFVIKLIGGQDALDYINNGINELNKGLDEAITKAAEFRNTLNQSIVTSAIELSAARSMTPGISSSDKITNIQVQKKKELNLLFQDEINARIKIRQENAKAGIETINALIQQNDALYKNKRELISINAERQITAEIQQNQAEIDRKATQELERQRKELERIAALRTKQLDDAQRSAVLTELDVGIVSSMTDEDRLKAEYDRQRAERMYKYTDLLKNALSEEERLFHVNAQENEIIKANIKLKQNLYALDEQRRTLLEDTFKNMPLAGTGKEEGFRSIFDMRIPDEIQQIKDAIKDLTDPVNQIIGAATAIGDAFSSAFRGIVSGSMTAQQALANFFQGIATYFMDMAAKIAAEAIKLQAIQILQSLLRPLLSGGLSIAGAGMDLPGLSGTGALSPGPITPGGVFAEGGFVTGPTRALIGEGGQPEYVIPASKMRSAMGRYAAGARGASVIAGSSDIGNSSGQATVVQPATIDVRYSISRINSVDYVTADQFQAGMQQAAAQGAARGEQSALRRLQQSRSTRNRLGLG